MPSSAQKRMGITRIEYPAWHDEARKLYAEGKTKEFVSDTFGMTNSMRSQILTPGWKSYCVLRRIGFSYNKSLGGVPGISKNIDKYEFIPVDAPTPKQIEDSGRDRASRSSMYAKKITQEAPAMANAVREFQPARKFEHGKTLTGARIVCSSCGKADEYFNYSGTVNPAHLSKEFSRMHWVVGGHSRSDKCPECAKSLRPKSNVTPIKPVEEPVEQVTVAVAIVDQVEAITIPEPVVVVPEPVVVKLPDAPIAVSTPPKIDAGEMGKTERRIIFAKLNDVYLDEKVGYADDWSDAKVAQDLGVPVEWVALVREPDFGPEITKELKAAAAKSLDDLQGKIERHILLIDGKLEQSRSIDEKLEKAVKEAEAANDRLDELLVALETHDKQIEGLLKTYQADVAEFKIIVAKLKG